MAKTPRGKAKALHVIERADIDGLLAVLVEKGYQLVGPTVRENAIVYDEITGVSDLPVGYTDKQERGSYRLRKGAGPKLFGYGLGPQSWKKYLSPPEVRMWQARRQNGDVHIVPETRETKRLALIGVRACELHAIAILDRVLMGGSYVDVGYQTQRQNLFIVAVNCGQAGKTCFCDSMNTGPKATSGFDLALTEILEAEHHYFVVETGSSAGVEVLNAVLHHPATQAEIEAAEQVVAQTTAQMGRSMQTDDLKELLYASYEHPEWDKVAARCLTCGNCTQVCPTCFCTTVEDVTDLTGDTAERRRKWDSCFTLDFSYIVGGNIRASAKSRYRQWMTHKLATWIDQFGTSGCVGCGRCITWCPVGIDITEEVRAIRATSKANTNSGTGKRKKHENP
jgi:ferredoxin